MQPNTTEEKEEEDGACGPAQHDEDDEYSPDMRLCSNFFLSLYCNY